MARIPLAVGSLLPLHPTLRIESKLAKDILWPISHRQCPESDSRLSRLLMPRGVEIRLDRQKKLQYQREYSAASWKHRCRMLS